MSAELLNESVSIDVEVRPGPLVDVHEVIHLYSNLSKYPPPLPPLLINI